MDISDSFRRRCHNDGLRMTAFLTTKYSRRSFETLTFSSGAHVTLIYLPGLSTTLSLSLNAIVVDAFINVDCQCYCRQLNQLQRLSFGINHLPLVQLVLLKAASSWCSHSSLFHKLPHLALCKATLGRHTGRSIADDQLLYNSTLMSAYSLAIKKLRSKPY